MKAIKLIIIFIVQLGGILGALYLLTNGEKDDPASPSDTNVIADTTAIGDTAIIENATDEDGRITDPLDEEEIKARPKKTMKKQEAVLNPSESKQSKNTETKKNEPKPSGRKQERKHKYTCVQCGENVWFNTKRELDRHIDALHTEDP